jgi:ABC-type cobalt transport system substrate-binding protein
LDGRGAPPTEKDAERDDQTNSATSQQEPVIHQIFDRRAGEVQALIWAPVHIEISATHLNWLMMN